MSRSEHVPTMTRHDELIVHLFGLVRLVESGAMKRALTTVDPNPHLNFWRLIHGSQLDIAVLEWCKVFGADSEGTHWKNIVPHAHHEVFREGLFAEVGVTAADWETYWKKMKAYRDYLVAHHYHAKAVETVANFPILDVALKSGFFYYGYLIKELRSLGEMRYPDNLHKYGEEFESQACSIATAAVGSTATMFTSTATVKERGY